MDGGEENHKETKGTKNNLSASHQFDECLIILIEEQQQHHQGRIIVVRSMIIATTVMILTMTFRIPYGTYAALFALTISREGTQETIRAVKTIAIAFAFGAAYELILGLLFGGHPVLRMVWIIVTLFIIFYALSTMTN